MREAGESPGEGAGETEGKQAGGLAVKLRAACPRRASRASGFHGPDGWKPKADPKCQTRGDVGGASSRVSAKWDDARKSWFLSHPEAPERSPFKSVGGAEEKGE